MRAEFRFLCCCFSSFFLSFRFFPSLLFPSRPFHFYFDFFSHETKNSKRVSEIHEIKRSLSGLSLLSAEFCRWQNVRQYQQLLSIVHIFRKNYEKYHLIIFMLNSHLLSSHLSSSMNLMSPLTIPLSVRGRKIKIFVQDTQSCIQVRISRVTMWLHLYELELISHNITWRCCVICAQVQRSAVLSQSQSQRTEPTVLLLVPDLAVFLSPLRLPVDGQNVNQPGVNHATAVMTFVTKPTPVGSKS